VRSLTALLAASAGSLRTYIVGRFHKRQPRARTHYFRPERAEPPESSKPSEGGCRGLSLVFDVATHGNACVLSTGADPSNLKCASTRLIFTRSPRPIFQRSNTKRNDSLDRCSCESTRRDGKLAEPGAFQFYRLFSVQLASESLQTARLCQRPSLTIQRKQRKEPIDKGTTLS